MGIPLAVISGPAPLNHARLEAQAARRDPFLPHFLEQGQTPHGSKLRGSLHQTPLAPLDDVDGMHKTHLIWVPIGREGCQIHQRAYGKVGQQQPVDLLLDSFWGLRTQRTCRQTQVRFKLINPLFDFPALVVDLNECRNRVLLGVNQGGYQADRLTKVSPVWGFFTRYSITLAVICLPS